MHYRYTIPITQFTSNFSYIFFYLTVEFRCKCYIKLHLHVVCNNVLMSDMTKLPLIFMQLGRAVSVASKEVSS